MKEFIYQFIQRLGTMFSPRIAQEEASKSEKENGNTRKLQRFLNDRFDFRHNQLTGVTEYRPKGIADGKFSPIDERNMNGMIVDARLKGIACWNSMVPTLVLSDKVENYHPFRLYMNELPEWDGTDRVTPLLSRVSNDSLWMRGGRYWLRALTAQWLGLNRTHANTLVPVLVSSEQGLGKSTFCRSLLPDSLRAYYLDNLNLSPSSSPEKKLVKVGLINLDEFDKISEKRQPDLKNLLQMMSVPVYRGKRLGYVTEPRLASFIATTNSRQILSDPTGSRRFLCVEVTDMIPNEAIEHKQLYAQLKQEVLDGERDYLNKEEEKEVQRRNKAYYRHSPLEDVFHACFRRPKPEEDGDWMTAAEIFRLMNKRNASALRGISAKQLSFRLIAMGFKPRHTMYGNCYHVVRAEAA